ncbi:hypothetical protein [Novosphingobium sp.]|uniref:hypothetical protein n=1 Tax=Novosphingobium sp. TaxID=1874826 RepID=UPI0025CC8856|nr:hypothetical protein [Novosphingobium sp.]MCC6926437.1 hypothetical protein [Novosphingobium sp.]
MKRRIVLLTLAAMGGAAAAWAAGQGGAQVRAAPAPAAPVATIQPVAPPPAAANAYPFYMPMQGLRRPAERLFVKCDASRAAGREVWQGRDGASLGGRAEGGFEIVYEAKDRSGNPCVYPFYPWVPQIAGSAHTAQYILRSSIPGQRVAFRSGDQWATVTLRLLGIANQRVHFEMSDIELDFPNAIQPKGAVHLEAFEGAPPGLFTAVIRRSKIFGGKNALFVPGGQTMLYVEDSEFTGNVGTNVDQEHATYINGILVSHLRNSVWRGQRGWADQASGHQLKDKAYLRIYENVTVANTPNGAPPSAMPPLDISSFGFTWSNGLNIKRLMPAQAVRDTLVDLRAEIMYGQPGLYPWNLMVDPRWRMPAAPLTALDQVYLSVFFNTSVDSYRTEPYVFALRPQGTNFEPGGTVVEGGDRTTRAQQRMVSLAFNTRGRFARVYSKEGWTFTDPQLPAGSQWVADRDAFIRHALGLIGR